MNGSLPLDHYFFNRGTTVTSDQFVGHHEFLPDDVFFEGHFPGDPVVPGVVLLLGMLTAIRLLVRGDRLPLATDRYRVEKIRFKRVLHPGDKVTVSVKPQPNQAPGAFSLVVFRQAERVALAEILWSPREGQL